MKCPSSCPLNVDEFPFFETSLARLEPEIEQFEVWSTFVGFFAICLVAQGDRKLANYDDDDGDGDDDSDDDDDDGDDDDYDDHPHHRQHHQP